MSEQYQRQLEKRARLMGPNIPTFYDNPVHIVKGDGVWLWDAEGRKFLDCYNNVPHVGHCNPRVVQAIYDQAGILNTHTRYLHDGILEYIERLTKTMDPSLDTAILTCTGSEANDIALRIAEVATGKRGIVATDATYHGNTSLVGQLRHTIRPDLGFGLGQYVKFVDAPDSYRSSDPDGTIFATQVADQIAALKKDGTGFAALIVCPFFLNEGFPDHKDGWLKPAAKVVHQNGGILICDEVQSGFGRTGTHFWAHEKMGVVPDILVLGKPMANGHPVGGVVARHDLIQKFQNEYRYFNTFGGNPVSCAAALAVLDEIKRENLVENARVVGAYAKSRMSKLAERYEAIGDIRGSGLVFGAEMVLDRDTKAPASDFADRVVNAMRDRGVLLSKLGRYKNTLKIRPPMLFSTDHADILIDSLDDVLATTPLTP